MNPNSDNSKSVKNVNDVINSQSVKNNQADYAQARIAHYAARLLSMMMPSFWRLWLMSAR